MHAVAVPKGVCWSCCPSIQSLYFLFYGGRAHIYSGVSFCYNLGPRTSPV